MALLEIPSRYQWEPSSGTPLYSQSFNCSVTVMTAIAQVYRQTWFGIETTRTNAGVAAGRPATYNENQLMLTKRGVPCGLQVIETLAELRTLVATRPVAIGVYMDRVPLSVAGHSFRGWHMLGVRALSGSGGFDILDPNFSVPGGPRPDPTGGHRYYSNAVIDYAFIRGERRLAVVPTNPAPKPVVKPPTQRTCTVLAPPAPDAIALRNSPNGPYDLYSNSTGIWDMQGNKWGEPGSRFNLMGSTTVNGVVWVRLQRFGRNLYVRRIHIKT